MKYVLLLVMLTYASFVLTAQGLYFDIGGGAGMTSNITQGADENGVTKYSINYYPRVLGLDISGKVGYGSFDLPLYFVGEVSWNKSHTKVNGNKDGFDTIFIGPGIVYYPSADIQVATSIGAVYTLMSHAIDFNIVDANNNIIAYKPSSSGANVGFGFNLSGGVDVDYGASGLLVGGKFSYSGVDNLKVKNLWGTGNTETGAPYFINSQSTVYVGIFLKYRFKG